MNYRLGEIYVVRISERLETYVVIVPYKHGLGFKSIVKNLSFLAIHIDVLKKYDHEYLYSTNSVNYIDLVKRIDPEWSKHEHLWELFDAEGWDSHFGVREHLSGLGN